MSSYCVRFAATGLPGKSPPDFTCPFPLRGMGGEQCNMERGISAMVNDGGYPFMFDGTLSFDRVLMPASQASTAWSGHPFHRSRGPPPPASRGRQGFGLIAPLLHVFLAHPHLGGGWRAEQDGRGRLDFRETANIRPLKRSSSSLSAFLQHHQTL